MLSDLAAFTHRKSFSATFCSYSGAPSSPETKILPCGSRSFFSLSLYQSAPFPPRLSGSCSQSPLSPHNEYYSSRFASSSGGYHGGSPHHGGRGHAGASASRREQDLHGGAAPLLLSRYTERVLRIFSLPSLMSSSGGSSSSQQQRQQTESNLFDWMSMDTLHDCHLPHWRKVRRSDSLNATLKLRRECNAGSIDGI